VTSQVLLHHVEQARQARDPQTFQWLIQVINSVPDPKQPPPAPEAYTFEKSFEEFQRPTFYRQPADAQAQQRIEKLKSLESETDHPLGDRYRSHEFIMSLWESDDSFDRDCLLKIIKFAPLVYGPWKALKQIFKLAEAADDTEVLGALSARIDHAFATGNHQVSRRTLGYLSRRAWRYLRRIAETLPACYADTAVDFVVEYLNKANYSKSWVYNHIFHHEQKKHGRTQFHFTYRSKRSSATEYHKTRAFPELWKRSPLPLFSLLQHADNDDVLQYAVTALKTDFRTLLREIEPSWVRQLVNRDKAVVHRFVVWLLENVPRFEQSQFRELELHHSVLQLLDSSFKDARLFAAKYARVHARDLAVDDLIRHANSSDSNVRDLAKDLISARDPRTEIGLEAWGQLLEAKFGHDLAVEALRKHFTADDLTPEWFRERILSQNAKAREFAASRLLEVHSVEQLGESYFFELFDQAHPGRHSSALAFAVQQIGEMDLDQVDIEWLQQLTICSSSFYSVSNWINQGLLNPGRFDANFLKSIAFHTTFSECPEVIHARTRPRRDYVQHSEHTALPILGWLSDIRQFTPDQIGFEWLMKLVQREEPLYHDFATELMIKSYLPADFAASENEPEAIEEAEPADEEINIDFEGATFVFTGKLATMTRAEAQGKVAKANGKKASTVNKSLGYLVIGDEGSPMYGMGRKGSKQVKAESLNESGAGIKIISETAFLQMLSGTQREFSSDAVQAGCETLWAMLIDNKEGSPLSRFAIQYVRNHHPEICLALTDRPVDPGAEIPDEFLGFENAEKLLTDDRKTLRDLGLELCSYEFVRMAPSLQQLVELCQHPFPAVRKFVAESLTAEPTPQNRRWRLPTDNFEADAVYQFCQSRDPETRAIGMKLIDQHPKLREPEQLFALTESPDRNVRAFVIRTFWSLYRERGVKEDWQPTEPQVSAFKKKSTPPENRFGTGAPERPDELPASHERMRFLLRRLLFEIPPGRPPKARGDQIDELKVKPLATRRGKILLIETIRDSAIKDQEFATVVLPVLREFMQSHGMSEHDSSLVAVTRIENAHPELKVSEEVTV
jgi:hypothetical protein